MKSKIDRKYKLSNHSNLEARIKPGVFLLFLLLAGLLLVAPVSAGSATTELTVSKLAKDGTLIAQETVDYQWMEKNLPIQGDGVTHYYHQGPELGEEDEDLRWNPQEDGNIPDKDYHAVKGTDVRDLCELVGGMSPNDTIMIKANDGMYQIFGYRNVYDPDPRQGPMVVTWWRPDKGYVPNYFDGMRLIFFADDSTNPWGWHVFGTWDMHECMDKKYWHYYISSREKYPATTGLSVKYIDRVIIRSQDPAPLFRVNFAANQTSGYAPLTVAFTPETSATTPTGWQWDFGDETAGSPAESPVHEYTEPGTYNVTLTVTAAEGTAAWTKKGYIRVSERPVLTAVSVYPADATAVVRKTKQFSAVPRDQNGKPMEGVAVSWSCDNETVGTVDPATGLFTALAEGTATVTATAGEVSGSVTVTVGQAPPAAKTIVVDIDGGGDYTTIQEAVLSANPGDTVLVRDGTYTENIDVGKRLTLVSEHGATAVTVKAVNTRDDVIAVNADNVTIEGFALTGATNEGVGLLLDGVRDCRAADIVASSNYQGIVLKDAENVTIRNSSANKNAQNGMSLNATRNSAITGCTISENTFNGICLQKADRTTILDCTGSWNGVYHIDVTDSPDTTIENCSMTSSKKSGLRITGSDRSSVLNSAITESALFEIVLGTSSDLVLEGNTFTGSVPMSSDGIRGEGRFENLTVDKNTVSRGMKLGSIANATVSGNSVSGGYCGIITSSSDSLICDNSIVGSYNGLYLGQSKRNVIVNNTCSRCGKTDLYLKSANENQIYLNTWAKTKDVPTSGKTSWISEGSSNMVNTPEPCDYWYNGTLYQGYLGNYYYNYDGTDADGDGIGDTPYIASATDQDLYPLMEPADRYEVLPPMPEVQWGPYLTGTTTSGTTVNWKTDIPAAGMVEYAAEAYFTEHGKYDRNVSAAGEEVLRHVNLTDLAPDTRYHYRVHAGRNVSADLTFRTFPAAGPCTFIVYGDTQEQISDFTQLERHKLVADRIAAEEQDAAFVVHVGDTVCDPNNPEEWDRFFASGRALYANTTLYPTRGNHEYWDDAEEFMAAFPVPHWYSFDCGDVHVAMLDSNDDVGPRMTEQTAWLGEDLAESTASWTFVAFHHPPYSSGTRHPGGWKNFRTLWGPTFEANDVDVVFNGHVHSYQRYLVNGTQYVVAATGGGPLYTLTEEKEAGYQNSLEHTLGYTRVTVDPANETMTMEFVPVADISEDNKEVLGIRPPGEVFDRVVIDRSGVPDLLVTGIEVPDLDPGVNATVTARVENSGGKDADAFAVVFAVDGAKAGTETVARLAAGDHADVSFVWRPAAEGVYELSVIADPDGAVEEADEENNIFRRVVVVGAGGDESDTLTLIPGWNFVSVPKRLAPGADTMAVFEAVDCAGHSIFGYAQPDGWRVLKSDDRLGVLDGIWIYAKESTAVGLTYNPDLRQVPPVKHLAPGWNAIGFSDTVPAPVEETLQSVDGAWSSLVGFDRIRQEYRPAVTAGSNRIQHMGPKEGYWIFMSEKGDLAAIGA
ncbi:parallel beta-helix repeat protein [Methanofollis sp. W23]|uniref:NosD domain-containing protein n=1 Tax=Methanofollis sp. W23 TaxID=2817849 RepID=UPI001AEA03F0|nr:NosD domain-containing protein [Methanofollis sp. W23]MBP2144932.1 parallel beta-helix repeat protein [Methanofollis sp. W23]